MQRPVRVDAGAGGRHRADIQGLRGVAVLLVVAYHSQLGVHGGFLGVDVFFVISGFVITQLLLRELTGSGSVRLGRFYGRRARRLLPALAVFVPLVLTVSAVTLNPYDAQPAAIKTAVSAQAFVANFFLYRHTGYFDAASAQNPFLHMWSLSIEEQFYLLFPLLLVAAWRWRRRIVPVLVAVGALSLVAALALTQGWVTFGLSVPERMAYYSSPTRAWELVAGALLAALWPRVEGWSRRTAAIVGIAGLVAVAVGIAAVGPINRFSATVSLIPVAGTVCLLAAGAATAGRGGPVTRALSWRPLTAAGDISYVWYLWHWPAIVIAVAVWPGHRWLPAVAAIAALAPSIASTRWLEAPVRAGTMSAGRILKLVALCTIVPLLISVIVWSGAQAGWGVTVPDAWYDVPVASESGCTLFNRDVANTWSENACTARVPHRRGTVLVLGDLAADSVSPGVTAAAARLSLDTAVWDRARCPFLGRSPVDFVRCREWYRDALALIDRLHPKVVVVSNDSPSYVSTSSTSPVAAPGDAGPSDDAATVATWRNGFGSMLDELARRRIPVVVVGPVPDYGRSFPRAYASVVRPHPPEPTLARRDVERRRRDTVAAERDEVARHPGATYVDPLPVLCPGAVCRPTTKGAWWYYDAALLNRAGGEALAPILEPALRRSVTGR